MLLFFLSISSSLALSGKHFSLEGQCDVAGSVFERIYIQGAWGATLAKSSAYYYTYGKIERLSRQSSSGPGSQIGENTQTSLEFLSQLIRELNVTSFLDVPCGDTNWQFQSWEIDSLPIYVGLDITRSVVQLNKEKFSFHSNKIFALWDFATCPLPKFRSRFARSQIFDMIHVRDVIQHMPLKKAAAAIDNIVNSGIKYLVASTYANGDNRENIEEGSWYPANLAREPFHLPSPVRCVETHPKHEADVTCLYILK